MGLWQLYWLFSRVEVKIRNVATAFILKANDCGAVIATVFSNFTQLHSDLTCPAAPSSVSSLSALSSSPSSSSSSSSSFFLPKIFAQGTGSCEAMTRKKKAPTATVAIVMRMSRGCEGPAFKRARVTEIHSLNLASKKVGSLHKSPWNKSPHSHRRRTTFTYDWEQQKGQTWQ